jgi:hypothetical protein
MIYVRVWLPFAVKHDLVDAFVEFDLISVLFDHAGEFFLLLERPEGDLAVLAARDCHQVECVRGNASDRTIVSLNSSKSVFFMGNFNVNERVWRRTARFAVANAKHARLHVVQVDVARRVADQTVVTTMADCATLFIKYYVIFIFRFLEISTNYKIH